MSSGVVIQHSTITGNTAPPGRVAGSEYWECPNELDMTSSIIAGNTNSDLDFVDAPYTNLAVTTGGFNLIGTSETISQFSGTDIVNVIEPWLTPLGDYGGPTLTHSLLSRSPALDAGDPNAVPGVGDVPAFDQRGHALLTRSG